MVDILQQIGSDPAKARRRSFEQIGGDWFEVTKRGKATARRKMTADEVMRINPIEGEPGAL